MPFLLMTAQFDAAACCCCCCESKKTHPRAIFSVIIGVVYLFGLGFDVALFLCDAAASKLALSILFFRFGIWDLRV
jgi:hypothetical protein